MKDDACSGKHCHWTYLPYFPLVVSEDPSILHVCALDVLVAQDLGLPDGSALQHLIADKTQGKQASDSGQKGHKACYSIAIPKPIRQISPDHSTRWFQVRRREGPHPQRRVLTAIPKPVLPLHHSDDQGPPAVCSGMQIQSYHAFPPSGPHPLVHTLLTLLTTPQAKPQAEKLMNALALEETHGKPFWALQ